MNKYCEFLLTRQLPKDLVYEIKKYFWKSVPLKVWTSICHEGNVFYWLEEDPKKYYVPLSRKPTWFIDIPNNFNLEKEIHEVYYVYYKEFWDDNDRWEIWQLLGQLKSGLYFYYDGEIQDRPCECCSAKYISLYLSHSIDSFWTFPFMNEDVQERIIKYQKTLKS